MAALKSLQHCSRLSLLEPKDITVNGTFPTTAALASVSSKIIEGETETGFQSIKTIPTTNVQQPQDVFMNKMSLLYPGNYHLAWCAVKQ